MTGKAYGDASEGSEQTGSQWTDTGMLQAEISLLKREIEERSREKEALEQQLRRQDEMMSVRTQGARKGGGVEGTTGERKGKGR